MSIQNTTVSASLTAQNTGTTGLGVGQNKKVNASISGTFVGTVHVQRKQTGSADSTYIDLYSVTAPSEKIIENVGKWTYRIFCKTGNFTSGTIKALLTF